MSSQLKKNIIECISVKNDRYHELTRSLDGGYIVFLSVQEIVDLFEVLSNFENPDLPFIIRILAKVDYEQIFPITRATTATTTAIPPMTTTATTTATTTTTPPMTIEKRYDLLSVLSFATQYLEWFQRKVQGLLEKEGKEKVIPVQYMNILKAYVIAFRTPGKQFMEVVPWMISVLELKSEVKSEIKVDVESKEGHIEFIDVLKDIKQHAISGISWGIGWCLSRGTYIPLEVMRSCLKSAAPVNNNLNNSLLGDLEKYPICFGMKQELLCENLLQPTKVLDVSGVCINKTVKVCCAPTYGELLNARYPNVQYHKKGECTCHCRCSKCYTLFECGYNT
jgi:hypothetical protein